MRAFGSPYCPISFACRCYLQMEIFSHTLVCTNAVVALIDWMCGNWKVWNCFFKMISTLHGCIYDAMHYPIHFTRIPNKHARANVCSASNHWARMSSNAKAETPSRVSFIYFPFTAKNVILQHTTGMHNSIFGVYTEDTDPFVRSNAWRYSSFVGLVGCRLWERGRGGGWGAGMRAGGWGAARTRWMARRPIIPIRTRAQSLTMPRRTPNAFITPFLSTIH